MGNIGQRRSTGYGAKVTGGNCQYRDQGYGIEYRASASFLSCPYKMLAYLGLARWTAIYVREHIFGVNTTKTDKSWVSAVREQVSDTTYLNRKTFPKSPISLANILAFMDDVKDKESALPIINAVSYCLAHPSTKMEPGREKWLPLINAIQNNIQSISPAAVVAANGRE
jgi:hypothetical protein